MRKTVSDLAAAVAAAIQKEIDLTKKAKDDKYICGYMDGLTKAMNIFRKEVIELKGKSEASYDDKTIVVQLDCLMPQDHIRMLRKDLLSQMEDGLIVIPGYAHVSYVGDACTVQILTAKMSEEGAERWNLLTEKK